MQCILYWLVVLIGLTAGNALQAQNLHRGHSVYRPCCHCHCACRDTVHATEQNNRLALLVALLLTYKRDRTPFGGGEVELSYAVHPRLTLGGYGLLTGRTASATNYGREATAPSLAIYELFGTARYQLLNARRW